MSLLPYLDSNKTIIDGSYIKALSFCKENCKRDKCKTFYESLIIEKKEGIYKCPYGLSVCLRNFDNDCKLFVSFRESSTYSKKNRRFLHETVYNPVLTKEQIENLINTSLNFDISNRQSKDTLKSVDSMVHELRKLNAQIKEHCDSIFSNYGDKDDLYQLLPDEYSKLFDRIKTLYVISTMINTRYSLYSYEKNPDILTLGSPINTNIYKKFDKCRKVLKNYQKKNVYINFTGTSYKVFKAYPSFEMIPFLLLENAAKYSQNNTEVNVSFLSEQSSLIIKIESFSPYCSNDELNKISERGFRGKNAERTNDGTGIGLYFVNILCNLHKILLSFDSDSSNVKTINGVPYSIFTVTLEFQNVYDMEDSDDI